MGETAGTAAAPEARCKNSRRGSSKRCPTEISATINRARPSRVRVGSQIKLRPFQHTRNGPPTHPPLPGKGPPVFFAVREALPGTTTTCRRVRFSARNWTVSGHTSNIVEPTLLAQTDRRACVACVARSSHPARRLPSADRLDHAWKWNFQGFGCSAADDPLECVVVGVLDLRTPRATPQDLSDVLGR